MAQVQGVHHVGLIVSDLDRSSAFYCKYFDLHELGRWPLSGPKISAALVVPDTDLTCALLGTVDQQVIVELIAFNKPADGGGYKLRPQDTGAAHVCFYVDDLQSLVEQMAADGVETNAPIQELVDGTPMIYLADPDGIYVEVLQPGPGLTFGDLFAAPARAS